MSITHFEETNPVSFLWQFPWLTQTKLGKALGVGQPTVSKWMCGTKPKKSVRRLAFVLQQQISQWSDPHFLFSFSTEKINPLNLLEKYPNLSRAELAEFLGVEVDSVNHWACGSQNPSNSAKRLAYELDKQWSALVQGNSFLMKQEPEKQIA